MMLGTDTLERQSNREQFKQNAAETMLALKNAPKLAKPKLTKEEKKALALTLVV